MKCCWYTGRWWVCCYFGTARRGLGGATPAPRCTKCNSPPINSLYHRIAV